VKPVLNLACYISLCEGLRAGAGSLSYIVHVICSGLSTIVLMLIIVIIIVINCIYHITTAQNDGVPTCLYIQRRRQRLRLSSLIGWMKNQAAVHTTVCQLDVDKTSVGGPANCAMSTCRMSANAVRIGQYPPPTPNDSTVELSRVGSVYGVRN